MCEHKKKGRSGTKRGWGLIGTAAGLFLVIAVITVQAAGRGSGTVISYQTEDTSRYEVLTNRHTQYVEAKEAENLLSTEGFEEKLNNGMLSVWYREETEALRVIDLRSGYVWGCIDDKELPV